MEPSMIIHSGAGSGKFPVTDPRFRELRNALDEGRSAMRRGSSLEGVESAVAYMEEAGVFNAGRGSCLTVDGRVQLDAAIMRGDDRKGAGVGAVTCTYHPVSLARWVMQNTRHVLLVADDCAPYAKAAGIKVASLRPSASSLARFGKLKAEPTPVGKENDRLWRSLNEGNTVGAAAIDSDGVPSAAVSTGGMWLKLPGRVGDSAVLGAGVYADRAGAASATGTGEEIIKNALCLRACEFIRGGDALAGARRAIGLISRTSGKGTAGIVTVDAKGRVGASFNTEAMGRAWYDAEKGRVVVKV
jgi:beta-aspartyl-peptidase (threonine type)